MDLIPGSVVQLLIVVKPLKSLGAEQVYLVEENDRLDVVGFAGKQQAVDITERRHRMLDCKKNDGLIDVGAKNVRTFAEVDRLAQDVVRPVLDFENVVASFIIVANQNMVTHSDRVGGSDSVGAHLPAQAAFVNLTIG